MFSICYICKKYNIKNKFMKKELLIMCLSFATLIASAQTFVSTSVENKNIILEEFTGISCGYCPDGHRIGQDLHDANPNDVFLINIHTGGYASPQGPGTDFRVDPIGANIASQSNLSGYPAGTVNRHLFSMSQNGGTAMSRGDWANASSQLLNQVSPVNVGLQASVDMATNVLTVDVEVYYTGTQTGITSNKLNIAVVQNNIEGPQSGASMNPTSVLPNGNYNHNHMLRHMMTGQWGEDINDISQDAFFSNQYTWTMPADINGVALDPTNIAVVAFVAEGNQEILSGTEIYPNIIFANQNDAYCMSSLANDAICGDETDIDVTFRNYGNQDLTSLDINYSINGGTTSTYPWTGTLAPGGTENITISNVAFTPQANNTVVVETSNPNGVTDQNVNNDQATTNFSQFSAAGQVNNGVMPGNAIVTIVTDQWGGETTWQITDDAGNVVASGGPYTNQQSAGQYPQTPVTVNLNYNECYSFLIEDSYGDGMNGAQYGLGSFTVTDAAGNDFITGGQFQSEVRESFNADGMASSITELETLNISLYPNPVRNTLSVNGHYDSIEVYDIYGKSVLKSSAKENVDVSSLSNGIYLVNIKVDQEIAIQKITVTK